MLSACVSKPAEERAGEWLAGGWLMQTGQPGAKPRLLVFEHQGVVWTGTITTAVREVELKDIAVNGEQVSYSQAFNPGAGRSITTQGVLKNGELHLTMNSPMGVTEQTAHKISAEQVAAFEAARPKKLSLPPLHDVTANGLASTPPMGWNSWNKFATNIDDATVRGIADALVSSGLRDAGFVYVNIDDGWQGERDANGVLHANSKFPDMKALGEYLHSRGLKFGIYSSPGPDTCGGYEGSYGHEEQDARLFADWGVDYLKYDLCSARGLYRAQEEMQAVYQKMGDALQATGHPIVYALCQYGMFDVGTWARKVGGNVWRTTGDISDSWQSMSKIGFSQIGREVYGGPGGWSDPDMLEVGNGGMSLDEYRTHMTLWSMLSAPLLLGHDVRNMTPEIQALLTNKEVIAIDQDRLGQQAHSFSQQDTTEVWSKALADGSVAIALFNRGESPADVEVHWSYFGFKKVSAIRDIWRQVDLNPQDDGYHATLPPHGSVLVRVMSKN